MYVAVITNYCYIRLFELMFHLCLFLLSRVEVIYQFLALTNLNQLVLGNKDVSSSTGDKKEEAREKMRDSSDK